MKTVPWMLLAAALAYIIFLQLCNKPKPADTVSKQQYHALERRLQDTSVAYSEYRKASGDGIENATAMAVQANERAEQSQAVVNASTGRIRDLLAMLDAADKEKANDAWIPVSPNYKAGCDSLRLENAGLLNQLGESQRDNQEAIKLMYYEISLRDSIMNRERDFNSKFRSQLDACMSLNKQQQKDHRPRAQLYAGFGVFGNQINPAAGAEINAALKTRSNQIYEVKAALIGNTWYAGAGTKFLLHF